LMDVRGASRMGSESGRPVRSSTRWRMLQRYNSRASADATRMIGSSCSLIDRLLDRLGEGVSQPVDLAGADALLADVGDGADRERPAVAVVVPSVIHFRPSPPPLPSPARSPRRRGSPHS